MTDIRDWQQKLRPAPLKKQAKQWMIGADLIKAELLGLEHTESGSAYARERRTHNDE